MSKTSPKDEDVVGSTEDHDLSGEKLEKSFQQLIIGGGLDSQDPVTAVTPEDKEVHEDNNHQSEDDRQSANEDSSAGYDTPDSLRLSFPKYASMCLDELTLYITLFFLVQ